MSRSLPIVGREELEGLLSREAVMAAVRAALIAHAEGRTVAPPASHMIFTEPPGDCHIKSGVSHDGDRFVVKVASGFYDNFSRGLPVNDGLVSVFDARTGQPKVIFDDGGLLTDLRTAAAGALAAQIACARDIDAVGVIGSGNQARRQAEWVAKSIGVSEVVVFARASDRFEAMRIALGDVGVDAVRALSVAALFDRCRLVVTCTPARSFIVPDEVVRPGTHIVAVGADMPGKQEIDPKLFARAADIVCDDVDQCADHGDFAHALALGAARREQALMLGDVLSGRAAIRTENGAISIVDLTGLGAQDVAIATVALDMWTRRASAGSSGLR